MTRCRRGDAGGQNHERLKQVKIDKETCIVIAIALAVLVAWGIYYPRQQAEEMKSRQRQAMIAQAQAEYAELLRKTEEGKTAPRTLPAAADTQRPETTPVRTPVPAAVPLQAPVTFGNTLVDFTINPNSGTIDKVAFRQFTTSNRKEPLVYDSVHAPDRTFAIAGLDGWNTVEIAKPLRTEETLTLSRILAKNGDRIRITQLFSLEKDSYSLKCRVAIQNLSAANLVIPALKIWTAGLPPLRNFSGDVLVRDPRYIEYGPLSAKKGVSLDPEMKDGKFNAVNGGIPVEWVGVTNKYFASLLFAEKPFDGGFELRRNAVPNELGKPGDIYHLPSICGVYKNVLLNAGSTLELDFSCFTGPKSLKEVRRLPESAISILHLSYFSWMEFLARPLMWLLDYLKDLSGSYGIAIILLTIIVRVVFWPVTQRANNSMRKMQKIQPKIKELREKYKERPQEMNAKMMELYREEKVNPVGGCLPILLQLPVFFALYSVLESAVELRHVSFLWATDLTKPDLVGPPLLFGYGIHPLILAMTALMVVQQKMTPTTMEPMQQKMMMAMPVIMLVMLYNLPSGLTLYWTVSQVFSILQMKYSQHIAKREDEKEALKSKSA